MKTLKFEGYSDDTLAEYGTTGEDYDNCSADTPIQCIVDCGEQGRVMVIGQYSRISCDNGCWTIGLSKVREDDVLPQWGYRFRKGEVPYSVALKMDVPDDFKLIWLNDGEPVNGPGL